MKKLICVTLLLAFVSLGFSQQAKEKSALQSMVDAELAFARMAAERGTSPAFMAFIAEDGILFRPWAVKGKQWMIAHPLPPSNKRPLLSWYPTVAGMAAAGDLGYTTGPWEYKNDVRDAKPVAFGNFLTVWKKQADGSWKFAIDLGISGPPPNTIIAAWQPPKNPKRETKAAHVNVQAEQALLRAKDSEFSTLSTDRDAQTAFNSFAAPDIRVFRDENPKLGNLYLWVDLKAGYLHAD